MLLYVLEYFFDNSNTLYVKKRTFCFTKFRETKLDQIKKMTSFVIDIESLRNYRNTKW